MVKKLQAISVNPNQAVACVTIAGRTYVNADGSAEMSVPIHMNGALINNVEVELLTSEGEGEVYVDSQVTDDTPTSNNGVRQLMEVVGESVSASLFTRPPGR